MRTDRRPVAVVVHAARPGRGAVVTRRSRRGLRRGLSVGLLLGVVLGALTSLAALPAQAATLAAAGSLAAVGPAAAASAAEDAAAEDAAAEGAAAEDAAAEDAAAEDATAADPTAADPTAVPDTGVVLVGTGDLHWTDIDRTATPTLWRLVATGSVGSVSVRTSGGQTCPVDAWLTISAGRRTTAPLPDGADQELPLDCVPVPDVDEPAGPDQPAPGTVVGWSTLLADDTTTADTDQDVPESTDAGTPGALGERIAVAGSCATAVGPGAAVALAGADGTVGRYADAVSRLDDTELTECPVTVLDLGDLGNDPESRRIALARLDRTVEGLAERLPTGWRLIVAGVSGETSEQGLPVVIDWQRGSAVTGWVTSDSTRRVGLVTLTDLTATLAEQAGADASGLDGSAITVTGDRRMSAERTVENRRYLTELTTTVTRLLPVLSAAVGLSMLLAGLVVLLRRPLGAAGRRAVVATLVVTTATPAGAFLASLSRWWLSPAPVVAASLWTVAAALAVALAAWATSRLLPRGPWRLAGSLALMTWLVLTVDGLTGTLLQQGSVLGASATVGARFYGFGNMAFSVYAAAALVLAGALAATVPSRRVGLGAAAAVGVVTVVVDGWPAFGADLGGILALVPAFVVLVLGLAGRRVTTRRVLAATGLAAIVALVVGIVDWLRPGPASHLGLFVQRVVEGSAWAVIQEKAAGAWATVANPVGALATVAVVVAALVLVGPWRPAGLRAVYAERPVLWQTVVAVVVAAGLGAVLNDSGIAVAVVVLGLVAAMLGVSWADHTWSGASPDEGDALVRSVPGALVMVAAGLAGALLLGVAVLPSQVAAGDVPRGEATPVVQSGQPIVVVGTAGLSWADVDRTATPAIWALVRDGAVVGGIAPGVTGTDRRCLASGWLSMSAGLAVLTGQRDGSDFGCLPWSVEASGDGADVTGWSDLASLQSRSPYQPHLGTLGDALSDAAVCSTAVGPGAALTLADSTGAVGRYLDLDAALADPVEAFDCPVTVVDAGAVPAMADPSAAVDPAAPPGTAPGAERDAALQELDATVRRVLAAAPQDAVVLLVDVGNPSPERPVLGVGAVTPSAGLGARYLSSPSTRWEGVARLLDVPTTVLVAAGVPEPADFTGSTLTAAGTRPSDVAGVVDGLGDLTRRDHALRGLSGWLTGTPMVVALLLLALAALVGPALRSRSARAAAVLGRVLEWSLVLLAALPVGLFVMTTWAWWRADDPGTALWLAMAGATATVAAVAALAPSRPVWAGPGVLAAITFGVLTLDALLGTPLHRGSPLGPSPTLGGRYYGFGNPTYSVYVVGALVLAAVLGWWWASRGHRVVAMVLSGAVGLVALLVDVLPGLGADVGGGLVLLPAAAVVVLAVGGIRVTWSRLLLIGVAGVVLVGGIGVLDWLRPADQRTHLGRFVQSLLDGTAWSTIERKAGYAAATLTTGPVAWLTLAVLVLGVLLVWPRGRFAWHPQWYRRVVADWPVMTPLLVGLLIAAVAGSLVNDYGTRIATVLLASAVPLLGLAVVRSSTH
ncbi:hypothetical protein OEB99_16870 [Actinotalea sp. M2MS4P-6]|uniref:hypothetical protein n=1 Tax=Actinotalea sp. M2MS4P-6 TaxID=2983762 RepID=UPI0021E37C9A|nr:hypothetical protein [Actinotalea sp. M2MS4P-6]MCV2395988.1 hypothetical protein [Actinotalea sp. M2MS4P-6]